MVFQYGGTKIEVKYYNLLKYTNFNLKKTEVGVEKTLHNWR